MGKQAQRPGITFCICPDGQMLKTAIQDRLVAWPPPQSGFAQHSGWTRLTFWTEDRARDLPASFWDALTLRGLFAIPQVIVLREAQRLPEPVWKKLDDKLACADELTWPFICLEGPWRKNNDPGLPDCIRNMRSMRLAESRQWNWSHPALNPASMRPYVQARTRQLGLRLAPGVLETLARNLPPDAAVIENELDKLVLLCGNEPVSAARADMVAHVPEFDIFAFVNSMQSGHGAAAWSSILHEARYGKDPTLGLIGLLQMKARQLWQLLAGEQPARLPFSQIPAMQATARRIGFSGLCALWQALYEAERTIKTGECDTDQALNALLRDLTRIFAPAGSGK